MSQPGDPGDHSVRSLAEILREHGLESEFGTRPGRRRRDDEPKADWPARPAPEDQPPSRLRPGGGAAAGTGARPARPRETPAGRAAPARPASPAAITEAAMAESLRQHGLETEFGTRPGRRRGEGAKADWPARPAPEDQPPSRLRPPVDAGPARVARPREAPREEVRAGSASVAAPPSAPPSAPPAGRPPAAKSPAAAPAGRRAAAVPPRSSRGAGPSASSAPAVRSPRTSGVPVTDDPVATGSFAAVVAGAAAGGAHDQDVEPLTAGQSALAWVRFAGELLLAVAVGVGTYFGFTLLWELMPYVAVVAAPLVLTGLVAGVAAWRHRREQAQLGVPLLAVLVFAGTLLVIAPAAGLLTAG
jgi:hypothetical protein